MAVGFCDCGVCFDCWVFDLITFGVVFILLFLLSMILVCLRWVWVGIDLFARRFMVGFGLIALRLVLCFGLISCRLWVWILLVGY